MAEKLVFEFIKTGNMVYISHLDVSKLFLRVLRMSGLRPAYSQGFNPHPKMSFALPLSVGIHSVCELLEFEMDAEVKDISHSIAEVNERLPEGMRVKSWYRKPESLSKSLASLAMAAAYEFMCDDVDEAPEKLVAFFKKDSVIASKRDKKSGGEKEVDIRSLMHGYRIVKDMRGRILAEAILSAAPSQTLNPRVFWEAFCNACGIDSARLLPVITRTAILGAEGGPLTEKLK